MDYIILIVVAIVCFVLGRMSKQVFGSKSENELKEMREEAREALAERTENRKQRILEFIRSETVRQEQIKGCDLDSSVIQENRVDSGDIEKLLGVSGNTARKYLNELEAENKIKQIGDSGRGVYYIIKD
jgi:Fic family protein